MEVLLNVLTWIMSVVAIFVALLLLHKVFRGHNKKNLPNPEHSQPAKQSGPVTAVNHEDTSDTTPAAGSNKAVPVQVKTVTVEQPNSGIPVNNRTEILNLGKSIYLSPRNRYTGPNNRKYTDEPGYSAAKYILAEERFITNHDDTAMFIELIDEDEKVMKSWKFDCPMKKWFSDPDYYEDDCLVFYMTERFHLPTVGYRWPK